MPFPADGSTRRFNDALDRRDEALYRSRRLFSLVAGGAVTASVALGVVFAQALPGHSAAAATAGPGSPQTGASAGAATPAASGGGSSAQSGAGQAQPTQSAAPPPAPTPAPPQVVSGGS